MEPSTREGSQSHLALSLSLSPGGLNPRCTARSPPPKQGEPSCPRALRDEPREAKGRWTAGMVVEPHSLPRSATLPSWENKVSGFTFDTKGGNIPGCGVER